MKQLIKNAMSKKIITVGCRTHMVIAAELMEERGIRHLPVCDETGKIVGILSNRDVFKAMNPNAPGFKVDCLVEHYMSWPVLSVPESTSLKYAAETMIEEKISALLVTNKHHEPVGIITSEDLLKKLVEMLPRSDTLSRLAYSPVVGELIKEIETAGI